MKRNKTKFAQISNFSHKTCSPKSNFLSNKIRTKTIQENTIEKNQFVIAQGKHKHKNCRFSAFHIPCGSKCVWLNNFVLFV